MKKNCIIKETFNLKKFYQRKFYYINQPCITSFHIGLAKTKSAFIVRSDETGLGRQTLVVAVSSVDAYPFFGFLRPDLSSWGYRNRCFLVALCCPIVRRSNLEGATKSLMDGGPSAVKNMQILLMCMEVCPYIYFWWFRYFRCL